MTLLIDIALDRAQATKGSECSPIGLMASPDARRQLENQAEVNRMGVAGEWEFNQWCHGRSGQPMGYPHQAWSAGMYVFAYHCVARAAVPIIT